MPTREEDRKRRKKTRPMAERIQEGEDGDARKKQTQQTNRAKKFP